MKNRNAKILVVDDDAHVRLSLQILLEQNYNHVKCLNNPQLIPSNLNEESYDVVLLDMNFTPGNIDGKEGLTWLKKTLEIDPDINVIIITAYGDVTIAVEALKLGATDFVVKPFQNEKLIATVNTAIKLSRAKKSLSHLKSQQKILNSTLAKPFSEMIGESPIMQGIYESINKIAQTDANILILGENGTGKELIARTIHKKSLRANEIFISVDLGAITETLFESELFGHEKGAFTDAKEDRIGRFEAASGGTLFLDEIGNLSLPLQSKLLTAIQNKQIFKVGSTKPVDIDIRLVCATNKPLRQMITEGDFRQDLLYRINTVEVQLPALRERKEDIPLLVDHFINVYCRKYNKHKISLPDYVIKKLKKFNWPGNIRELQHAIERAVIMSEGNTLRSAEFSFLDNDIATENNIKEYNLGSLERWAIANCLKKHKGNISKAAPELGLTRGALYRRLEKYDL